MLHRNRYGQVEAVHQLLVREASVGARDVKGNTPLHLACGEGGADVVRQLVAHGSPLDVSWVCFMPAARGTISTGFFAA